MSNNYNYIVVTREEPRLYWGLDGVMSYENVTRFQALRAARLHQHYAQMKLREYEWIIQDDTPPCQNGWALAAYHFGTARENDYE